MRDYSKLGQVLYKFFDWAKVPGEGGAFSFEKWETLHTGPGEYNSKSIDDWLDRLAGRPAAFSMATHISSHPNWPDVLYDCTPTWLYDRYDSGRPVMNGRRVGHIVEYKDKNGIVTRSAIPAYEDISGPWWRYLRELHTWPLARGMTLIHA